MGKIIDFQKAKQKYCHDSELEELRSLSELSHSLDTDAALYHHCGLPGGDSAEADKLNTLLQAFQSNPYLKNLDLTGTDTPDTLF